MIFASFVIIYFIEKDETGRMAYGMFFLGRNIGVRSSSCNLKT